MDYAGENHISNLPIRIPQGGFLVLIINGKTCIRRSASHSETEQADIISLKKSPFTLPTRDARKH
jgi:hypothetical protein